jgi:hypothetical protein
VWITDGLLGKTVGDVELSFSDNIALTVPIVVGESLRETWWYVAKSIPMTDPHAPGVVWKNVLEQDQDRGGKAKAVIDMLTIQLPAKLRSADLNSCA